MEGMTRQGASFQRGAQLVGCESVLLGSRRFWGRRWSIFLGQHVGLLNTVLRQVDTDLCSYTNSINSTALTLLHAGWPMATKPHSPSVGVNRGSGDPAGRST